MAPSRPEPLRRPQTPPPHGTLLGSLPAVPAGVGEEGFGKCWLRYVETKVFFGLGPSVINAEVVSEGFFDGL